MKNRLHIVYSLGGTVKLFLKNHEKTEDVLVFEDSLAYGLLLKNFSDEEVEKRAQTWEDEIGKYCDYPSVNIQEFINFDFDKYKEIVVWHGDNANERLMLCLTCSLVKNNLSEVDITELKHFIPHMFYLSLNCCSIGNIEFLYDTIKPISSERKQEYIQLWNQWSHSDSTLRIVDTNNTIIAVNEDCIDEQILSNCTPQYTSAARVIGQTLSDCNFLVGDGFLLRRIISLARNHKLSVCANERARAEIEESNRTNRNKIIVNGVNVSEIRFFFVACRL